VDWEERALIRFMACKYVSFYVCACMHITGSGNLHTRVRIYACMPVHIYAYLQQLIMRDTNHCVHAHTREHAHTYMHFFKCTHVHVYMRICMYMHAYTTVEKTASSQEASMCCPHVRVYMHYMHVYKAATPA
jgi:hypothetical protein